MDYPDSKLQMQQNGWIRIRDEGDKVTLTYKQTHNQNIDGSDEIEVTVGSYAQTIELMEAIGLRIVSRQESRRETWVVQGVEVVLDEWPWVKPSIEIEGDKPDTIRQVAEQLGFNWGDAVYGNATEVYRAEFPGIKDDETIGEVDDITFDSAVPQWLLDRR